MTDETLKNCPFCGGEARLVHVDDSIHYVTCDNDDTWQAMSETKEAAISAWNNRADTPSISICKELNKCQRAFNELQEKQDKLLAFVKKIDEGMPSRHDPIVWLCDIIEEEARELLEEIGHDD